MPETNFLATLRGFTDGSFDISVANNSGYNSLFKININEETALELGKSFDAARGQSNTTVAQVIQTAQLREARLAELRKNRDRIDKEIAKLEQV